jgi:hypothetical protein
LLLFWLVLQGAGCYKGSRVFLFFTSATTVQDSPILHPLPFAA